MQTKYVLIPLIFSLVSACSKEAPLEKPEVVRPVKILTVGVANKTPFLELPGSVHATRETNVAFEVPGRIIEIVVDEGDLVETGKILAKLDPRDFKSARDSALARRNAAKADYKRYVDANRANAVTKQSVDIAKRNLDVAQADLETAEKALEDTVLKAPFKGRIAKKIVDEFTNVQAKQSIVALHDESSLEVRVDIAQRDWADARPGVSLEQATKALQPVVTLSALPGREFPAYAKSFSTAVDPVTRTYEATFSFLPPTDNNVSPGMTAQVKLKNKTNKNTAVGMRLPASAVFSQSDGQASVWLLDEDNRVRKQRIVLGPLVAGELSVIEGLKPEDRVAVSGVHVLTEGTPVRAFNP